MLLCNSLPCAVSNRHMTVQFPTSCMASVTYQSFHYFTVILTILTQVTVPFKLKDWSHIVINSINRTTQRHYSTVLVGRMNLLSTMNTTTLLPLMLRWLLLSSRSSDFIIEIIYYRYTIYIVFKPLGNFNRSCLIFKFFGVRFHAAILQTKFQIWTKSNIESICKQNEETEF